jgi:hypothetical protein
MEIEFQSTFEKCLFDGINLFTGAGFSVLAKDCDDKKMPVGDMLKNELAVIFPGIPKTLKLPQICSMISRTKKQELREYLNRRFTVSTFDDLYHNLNKVEIKNVFTTNIDDLFQKVFISSPNKYTNDVNLNGASFKDKLAIDYFYMHGSVTDQESELIFGDLDIASAFSKDPNRWHYLTSIMGKFPTLFWGYALKDAGTLQAYANSLQTHNNKNSWIILHPDYLEEGESDYFKSIGFKIVISETETFLKYLQNVTGPSSTIKVGSSSEHPFPEGAVPCNANVEHRAIQDFFQGSTPLWSDIYSPRVMRIQFYDQIIEKLNNSKNILITGGPASGKTTLLMQLAAFYSFDGYKIFTKDISPKKANTIAARAGQSSCMFFIDEFQSSIDALETLSKINNARFVLAERDYAYLSSPNSRFLSKSTSVFDITEITDFDSQEIFNNIPADIRSTKKRQKNDRDSLFEFIESNCKTPNIKRRFQNVIGDLRKKDTRLVDLFLLVCYLHTARSVASMDIFIGYFQNNVKGYEEIYNLISILGSCINDYAGCLAEQDQDYFNIRSNLLADLIYSTSPVSDLAKMLCTFHRNVSTYCIPNYNVFKRRGYDSKLFERAFPNIKDGIDLYDIIYKKHSSPFNLQQKALYLSGRNEYELAFKIMDEAISIAGSKNWPIKNSYAIIKFKANINRENATLVRKSLDESMDALEECYTADIRKVFHAITFADHSLQYWRKYRDGKALEYLNKSIIWLGEEQQKDYSINKLARFLRELSGAISTYS